MMKRNRTKRVVAINGEFYCRAVTGVERLAKEVTKRLDALCSPGEIELVVPKNAVIADSFCNILVVPLDKEMGSATRWMQAHFQMYVLKHKRIPLDYSNTCPFFTPGIEFIHDIYPVLFGKDYDGKDRLKRLYCLMMYRVIAKRAKEVITVSEYSKSTIIKKYRTLPSKISVVYSGVGLFNEIEADEGIIERLGLLGGKEFYFCLGSLSVRKNLKWVANHARMYPNETFVISGQVLLNVIPKELQGIGELPNVIIAGYLKDGEVKALMKRCKAFIFPSYFEGFGLPPLEALSAGAKVVISNRTSMQEIYGDCAYYIDPEVSDVDLDALLKKEVKDPAPLLQKFTLQNSAKRLYSVIAKYTKGQAHCGSTGSPTAAPK